MTTLKYKLFETGLRLLRYRHRLTKDIQKEKVGSAWPKGQYAERFQSSDFQGRKVWTVHPQSGESPNCYVHFHGGAYVYRLLDIHFPTLCELADQSGVSVIVPDYPIYPVIAQETHQWSTAFCESVIQARGLGNVSIGGCSAGGNLALSILQLRREAGQGNPRETILWSPWVDLSDEALVKARPDHDPILSIKGITLSAKRFAQERDGKDPLISPTYADLNGLSNLHIFTGEKDLLHADIAAFAEKAKAANCLKTYQSEPEFGHYWMFYPTKDRHRTIAETAALIRGFKASV
jgi:acetyl esterase/lipase